MKITVICDVLGEANNGTTLAALNLISYLREAGHTVTVVSPDRTTEGKEGYFVVPQLHLGKFLDGVLEKNGVVLARADEGVLWQAICDADVVHLLVPFALSIRAVKIAKEMGKPLTASFHCQAQNFTAHIGLMRSSLANHLTYRFFRKKVYRHVDAVHFPTAFIRDVFEKSTRRTYPSYVISNGVNDRFFLPAEPERLSDKFTIVCTGRYSKEKNQQMLLRAVARSRHKDDICVVFAGAGPKEKKLRRLAKKTGVDTVFRFFDRETLVRVLHGADLYVHTAVIEIEAIACMEAITAGLTPVICDAKGSATRYFAVDENTRYRDGSVADLTAKIDLFYEDPALRQGYREKYTALCRSFSQRDCMAQMERMLSDVVDRKRTEGAEHEAP